MIRNRLARRHRFALAGFALTLVLGVGLTPGTAGAAGPITVSTLTDTNRDCNGAFISPSTKTMGTVVMAQIPRFLGNPATLITLGTVQGATPRAAYDIRIIQESADGLVGSCSAIVGKVTTDGNGNGILIATTPVLAGSTKWWVDLNNQQNFADYLDTDLVAIAS